MFQEDIGPALSDEDETVELWAERFVVLEIIPEAANGLTAIVVRGAHAKTPLDLAGKLSDTRASKLTVNQEVVSVPAEILRLEMNLDDGAIDQDWRNASYEQLRKPVSSDMLLEESARSTRGYRTRC